MPAFKLIVSDSSTGKSSSYELEEQQTRTLIGVKIGDVIDGSVIGVEGKIKIKGGSDRAGFPMRSDVQGGVKKYALLTRGVGFKQSNKGEKRRKLVRGNTITDEIYQVNAVLIK